MTSENTTQDLHQGRGWLNRAADALSAGHDSPSSAVQFARAAAMIGCGFIQLAHTQRSFASMEETSQVRQAILTLSDEPETTLAEAITRERRADAEARPHDGEPRGEAAYLLEGDDEIFTAEPKHAVDEGVVWVVADEDGPLHAAATQALAQTWAAENRDAYEGLSVTAMAVDRA